MNTDHKIFAELAATPLLFAFGVSASFRTCSRIKLAADVPVPASKTIGNFIIPQEAALAPNEGGGERPLRRLFILIAAASLFVLLLASSFAGSIHRRATQLLKAAYAPSVARAANPIHAQFAKDQSCQK